MVRKTKTKKAPFYIEWGLQCLARSLFGWLNQTGDSLTQNTHQDGECYVLSEKKQSQFNPYQTSFALIFLGHLRL